MSSAGEIILAVIGIIALIFVFPILCVALGAFTGWIVGLVFESTILGILAQVGITGVKMWQVGACLGFIGGFFRNVNSK